MTNPHLFGPTFPRMSPPHDPVESDIHPFPIQTSPMKGFQGSVPQDLNEISWQHVGPPSRDSSKNVLTTSITTLEDAEFTAGSSPSVTPVAFSIGTPNTSDVHLPALPPIKNHTHQPVNTFLRGKSPSKNNRIAPPSPPKRGRTKTKKLSPPPGIQPTRSPRKLSPTNPSFGNYHLRTELPVFAVVGELLRVLVDTMKMKTAEGKNRDSISCTHKQVNFEVSVRKDTNDFCTLQFEWQSGGSHRSFQEICEEVVHRVIV